MNRQKLQRRKTLGLPVVSGSTRQSNESRRQQRRRLNRRLPVYKPEGGNSGSNIREDQQYVDGIWSGTAFPEG